MTVALLYGTRTALAGATELDAIGDGVAKAWGEIVNTATATDGLAIDYVIHNLLPFVTNATIGAQYEVYMVSSQDGAEWDDDIDPSATIDVALRISEAKLVAVVDAGGTATTREQARITVQPGLFYSNMPPFLGLVFLNNSGQTTTNGFDGDSMTVKYATE